MVSNATEFQVTEIRQELMDTAARPERLQRISELTGSASLEIGIASLPALLKIGSSPHHPLRTPQDNGLVAFLVIAFWESNGYSGESMICHDQG